MTSYLPSSIQKRLLRYALLKTGFLDTEELDLDSFDLTLGRQNTVELRNVGLHIQKLSTLLELPAEVRLETARITRLRLNVPADLYYGSITAEADGIHCGVAIQPNDKAGGRTSRAAGSPGSPSHRKTHRRIQHSPPYEPTGKHAEFGVPTTQDLARSFLMEEPADEVHELEERYGQAQSHLAESVTSDLSDTPEVGTGATPGLPGFLAGFLQGIIDRFQLLLTNITAEVTVPVPFPTTTNLHSTAPPVTIKLHVERVNVGGTEGLERPIQVESIGAFIHGLQQQAAQTDRRNVVRTAAPKTTSSTGPVASSDPSLSSSALPPRSPHVESDIPKSTASLHTHQESRSTGNTHPTSATDVPEPPDPFDIRPGEDNFAWNFRRSESASSTSDLWSDSDPPADLEASIYADQYLSGPTRASTQSSHSSPLASRRLSHSVDAVAHTRSDETPSTGISASVTLPANIAPGLPLRTSYQETSTTTHSSAQSSTYGEDLAESRLYTEEEAESLYLSAYGSAFSEAPATRSEQDDSHNSSTPSIEGSTDTLAASPPMARSVLPLHPAAEPPFPSALDGGESDKDATAVPDQSGMQILFIDNVALRMSADAADATYPGTNLNTSTSRYNMAASRAPAMPGSFSVYADQSASVRFDDPRRSPPTGERYASPTTHLLTEISSIYLAFEFGMINDYLHLITTLMTLVKTITKTTPKTKPRGDETPSQQQPRTSIINALRFDLVHSAQEYWALVHQQTPNQHPELPLSVSLLSLQAERTVVEQSIPESQHDCTLSIGKFRFYVAEQQVVAFSDRLQESRSFLAQPSSDISVEMSSQTTPTSRTTTQIAVHTKQLDLTFDFGTLSAALDQYGGLSGLLELTSSFVAPNNDPSPPKPSAKKGVRFQDGETAGEHGVAKPESNVKVNARIEGVNALFRSRTVAMKLVASSVKTVARPEFIAATIDRLQLLAPILAGSNVPGPAEAIVNNLRFEYLFHPTDADLERLLALLTPSKNKYESDEDILIDTLLRQRRKGAVVRLTMGLVKARVTDWTCIAPIQLFAEEMSTLSAVAKYLPEDERPGLLSLIRIHEAQAEVPVNDTFGSAIINLKDCNIAQIGLPSLLAVAIGTVHVGRQGSFETMHPLMHISPTEDLPMIMARMIGDEVEPTLKLKFFNVSVEYSVPILLALTELGLDATADQVVDLAASAVAELTTTAATLTITPSSTFSAPPAKKLGIDVLFHQCSIGLQPSGLPSKALLVLDNAKITTVVPPQESIKVKLELRKATVHIADKAVTAEGMADMARMSLAQRLPQTLRSMGYVSVCSIMAAAVDVQIKDTQQSSSKSVEVDVRNELFLMETCADSTRTLIQTLGALAPPTPPSSKPKFRTEPMSLDEMVSSFTGDAFERPCSPPSTIFDTDTAIMPTEEDLFDASMSESMYGGFGDMPDPDDDLLLAGDAPMDTAESLLEEDPFEFPDNPNATKLNNRDLAKDLDRQLFDPNLTPSDGPKPFFLSAEQIERLPGESAILGADYRFNNPRTEQKPIAESVLNATLPFRLRLREVHIIWNLYDGYDWQGTRQAISQAVDEVELRAEERRLKRMSAPDPEDEESIIGDCLFNSIYIGVPTNKDVKDLRRQINRNIDDLASETESYATSGISKPTNFSAGSGQRGRKGPRRLKLERSRAHKISFELKGVSADILVFPPDLSEVQNSVDVRVRDFEIFDNLPTSTWRKFLTSWHKDGVEREMAKPMMHLELTSIKPMADLTATELLIRVTVMPIRLHVDQDALDFITRFFDFKDTSAPSPPASEPPFVQRLEIYTVDMSLDYKPKRVDYTGLRSGRYTEFKNFFILDAAHIKLKHTILYGLNGFDTLHDTLSDIWTPDIKRNQLPSVLGGLAGVSPLVSLGAGIADVIAVPVREYRKDGRIVRSIQQGALHLARNTTSEVARFGARVAVGTQNALLGAEGLFVAPPAPADDDEEEPVVSAYANQPLGVMQGLRSARRFLERDLLTARDAVIAVQGEVLEGGSAKAAAAAVARHAPTILLRPVIGATRAVGQTLMGVGNQVDKRNVRRIEDKYKQR